MARCPDCGYRFGTVKHSCADYRRFKEPFGAGWLIVGWIGLSVLVVVLAGLVWAGIRTI